MPNAADGTYEKYLETLTLVDKPPNEAFLRSTVFATRASTTQSIVKTAFVNGRINLDQCVAMYSKNKRLLLLLINWNTEAYPFILSRDKQHWPSDFKKNKAKKYKPIKVSKAFKKPTKKQQEQSVAEAADVLAHIDNLQDAKLTTEKLKIKEMMAAQQRANNEVLLIEDVIQVVTSIAYATKSQLRRFITLVTPELPRCKTPVEMRKKLEEYMQPVLNELEPMLEKETYTKEKR